jgi:hypothetical protein
VNWILWSPDIDMAMIIVPEEAEHILSIVNGKSPTHLLTYAAPVTRRMLHFNDLKYYAIPPLPADWEAPMWLKIELGIFAGRLYFEYDEYATLCSFLGIVEDDQSITETIGNAAKTAAQDEREVVVEDITVAENVDSTVKAPTTDEKKEDEVIENVWVVKAKTAEVKKPKTFTAKPLTFMQEWLSLRRKGQDFAQTPMGYICQGKVLKADHPFFSKVEGAVHVPVEVEKLGEGSDWNEGEGEGDDGSGDGEYLLNYDGERDDNGSMDVNVHEDVDDNEGYEG